MVCSVVIDKQQLMILYISEGDRYVDVVALPLLYEPLWQAAKKVKCPDPDFPSLYDQWLSVTSKDYDGVVKPFIGNVGSGSDYTSFIQRQGISCSSMSYVSCL